MLSAVWCNLEATAQRVSVFIQKVTKREYRSRQLDADREVELNLFGSRTLFR